MYTLKLGWRILDKRSNIKIHYFKKLCALKMTVSSVVVEFDLLIRSQMISALCALVFNKTLPLLLMTVAFELVTLLQTHCIYSNGIFNAGYALAKSWGLGQLVINFKLLK